MKTLEYQVIAKTGSVGLSPLYNTMSGSGMTYSDSFLQGFCFKTPILE